MVVKLSEISNYYRSKVHLDLPPGANFIYHAKNSMGFGLLPSVANAWFLEGEFSSEDVVVVGDVKSNNYILVGALTAYRSLTFFSVIKHCGRFHSIEIKQPYISEDETPEEIVLLQGYDWRKLLIQYAELAAAKSEVPKISSSRPNITGYCSWYYYYEDITEKDFIKNVNAIQSMQNSTYCPNVIQIDDGYQTFHGDWLDQDSSWPTPLSKIAEAITSKNLQAGIWLMPFQASTVSRIFQEHPDWFVKNEDGTPAVSKGWSPPPNDLWACLDMTLPIVQHHIVNILKTFRSWGFTYFKLDGMNFGLMRGKRNDLLATPVSSFRKGLEVIRQAVPDVTLLACTAPFMPCLGLVDMCRVGSDTCAYTPSIEHSFQELSGRWWMFDRFFCADPDVVIARQDRAKQSIGASRISVLSAIITGVSLTSDNLGTIAPKRLELLSRAGTLRLVGAIPLKWKQDEWIRCFSGTLNDQYAVALFNDTDKDLNYDLSKLGFSGQAEELIHPLGIISSKFTLPAHDAALLINREV